jgi:transcriptional regulator with XRE-family HTH domain
MDTLRLGSLIRAVRVRRGLRQRELAGMCEVGQTTISLVERGHGDRLSLATLDQIARSLDIRVDLVARWRGGDAERLLSHRHSELAASVAARIGSEPGWTVFPEVSFSVYGERGVVDQLAWHAAARHLIGSSSRPSSSISTSCWAPWTERPGWRGRSPSREVWTRRPSASG